MASKVRDYSKLAHDIIVAVGGESNIVNATRCATRLRLVLKETPKDATAKVSSMPGVVTVVEKGGQYQVVIGPHVGEVYDIVAKELNLDANQAVETGEKQSLMNRIIAAMAAVFAPFVYVLAAAGLIQGCLIILKQFAPTFTETGTYSLLNLISWAPFTFLPIFIAISASKHFKCNTYVAVACCCALVSPSWATLAGRIADGESIKFLLFPMASTTYTSTVLPPLFLVLVLSYLEHFLMKKLPDVIKSLAVPFLCIVVMVPATILVIGPISEGVAGALANGYNMLYNAVPALAAMVVGGFWQVLVIFGVHWGFTPLTLMNFDTVGYDTLQVFKTCAVVAQAAACFGVYFKSRNKDFKNVAFSAGLTGVFGITEPAIYGVTLRLKKPLICGCIAAGIGSAVASFFGSVYYVYAGLPGILTVVNAIGGESSRSFIGVLVGCAISIIGSLVLVQAVGFDDPVPAAEAPAEVPTAVTVPLAAQTAETVVASPMNGEIKPLSEVNDPTFSGGLLGQGVAILPSEGKLYAPFDGVASTVFDTKHALGLSSNTGVEMLIHVGLETVTLGGKHFRAKINTGDSFKRGDLLLEFDLAEIKKQFDTITPVLVTNMDEFSGLTTPRTSGKVKAGETVMTVQP